jgi:hypothetical protein
MTIKEQLISVYKERINDFKNIVETFPDTNLAGPLLMSPNNKYEAQPKRLLIIGQQTNGWISQISDVKKQMGKYERFNLGIKYYPSPFWNITRKLEKAIGIQEYSCAWTNINKFDLNAKKPYGDYEKEIKKLDDILITEIEIIKPDICVFFTGPSFDNRIKSIFEGVSFNKIDNWDKRQLAKLKHPLLPEFTVFYEDDAEITPYCELDHG